MHVIKLIIRTSSCTHTTHTIQINTHIQKKKKGKKNFYVYTKHIKKKKDERRKRKS